MELRSAGRLVAKSIGIASGLVCALIVGVFLFANPDGTPTLDGWGAWMLIMPVLALLGLAAVIATIREARRTLLGLCVVSFCPFGAYLCLYPFFLNLIGLMPLGYGLAAAGLWLTTPGEPRGQFN